MNNIIKRAALAALATLAACAPDDVSAPASAPDLDGAYTLRVASPDADDAGLLVLLGGARVDSVTATAGSAVLLASDAGDARLVLTARDGAPLRDVVATIWTRDGAVPRAELREVAARGTHAQRDLAGYALHLTPARAAR